MLNVFHHSLESVLSKTIIGNVYYLRNNNFQKILYDRYKEYYLETFKLPNKLRGEFEWKARRNNFRNVNMMDTENYLKIYNEYNKIVLIEDLVIVKSDLSFKRPPSIFHSILQDDKVIDFRAIDTTIYTNLIKQKQVLNSSY
jgi:hypothetical protein